MMRSSVGIGGSNASKRRPSSWFSNNWKVLFAFAAGLFIGNLRQGNQLRQKAASLPFFIQNVKDVPLRNTSHVDAQGRPITKRQFLDPFVIPTLTGFSVATLTPGQTVQPHDHEDMYEFFYIIQGTVEVTTKSEQKKTVGPNTFLFFAPHEMHGLSVPADSVEGEMKMVMFGIVPGRFN